jgi:hypothetical protein
MPREIHARYQDPLDLIWIACAQELGLEIARSSEVYASFDGQKTLTLTAAEHFDADDSLAQLIFHELCHALVAGPRKARLPDWGMENVDERDLEQEHACHRLQAALADRHGLREFFAVTTDWRPYWDALPLDPLGPGEDPAIPVAREAFERATEGPWAKPLLAALGMTQQLAEVLRELPLPAESLWKRTRPVHESGFVVGSNPAERCSDCAFVFTHGSVLRCRKTRSMPGRVGRRVGADSQACVRFEPRFDENTCADCGACCHEGFDRVDVRASDLVRRHHPELTRTDGFGCHLPRPDGRCVALNGQGTPTEPYRCRIYVHRPRACADFAIASDACLVARRRVGLSA